MTAADRYREEMGRDPEPLSEDDPLRWQYDYTGNRKGDRDRLADFLDTDPGDEQGIVIDGQEPLL